MKRTKVLISAMPPMLEDIVRNILEQHDEMDVATSGTLDRRAALVMALEIQADVVVLVDSEVLDTSRYRNLLNARPQMRVLAIAADGRSGYLQELRPHAVPLGELSPDTLVAAIRAGRAEA